MVYPLAEVLPLVVCGTICSCDDFDDITAWGKLHLDFLRRYRLSPTACPASAGGAFFSTGSIPSCSSAVLRVGWRRRGRTGRNSSPSTARRPGAPTIAERAPRRCTRSALRPPPPVWCWRNAACRRKPTRSPPFPSFSTIWPSAQRGAGQHRRHGLPGRDRRQDRRPRRRLPARALRQSTHARSRCRRVFPHRAKRRSGGQDHR